MENDEISLLVKNLSDAIVCRVNRDFKQFNLTMQQLKILLFLMEARYHHEETTQKDIQRYMRLSHSTVISILKSMELKGFIETAVSKQDKRLKTVAPTRQDDPLIKGVLKKKKAIEDHLLEGFTSEERANLKVYLEKMYHNIAEV